MSLRSLLRVAAGVSGLALCGPVACGGEDAPPKTPCGESLSGCSDRRRCDRVAVPARCVCDEAYTGEACGECAPGYRRSGSTCVAERVVCTNSPCGARGECLDGTDGSQACVCETGYTGNFCATCVDGYQDNDGDGVCQPSCGIAELTCQTTEACSDLSGEARCTCAPGLTGPDCDECEPGFRRNEANDGCVTTCAAPDFVCSGTCVETLEGAVCQCEPGHAGADCEECDEAHSPTPDGSCVAPLPAGALFWTVARSERQSYLGALLAPDFDFFPIAPIDDGVTDLAYDSVGGSLFGVRAGELVNIDPLTAELTTLIEGASGLGQAVARDPATGLVFVASQETIWRADVTLGEVTELSTPGASALAFDAARRLLLGVTAQGERVEIDPEDGVQRPLAALPAMEPLGLAVDATLGRAYALGALPEPPAAKLERFCTEVAQGLGVPRATRGLSLETDPLGGDVLVLEESGADPPLVAYGTSEDTADDGGTLRVETQHPDALVCVVTRSEALEIVVSRTANFSLLFVVSDEPNLTLTVEDGFSAPGAAIHLRAGGEVTMSGPTERVTAYTDDEWDELGLSTWAAAPDRSQHLLGLIDWRSGSSSFVALNTPLAVSGLSLVGVQ